MLDAPELASSLVSCHAVRPARLRPVAEARSRSRPRRSPTTRARCCRCRRPGRRGARPTCRGSRSSPARRSGCSPRRRRGSSRRRRWGAARQYSHGKVFVAFVLLLRTRPPFPAAKTKSVFLQAFDLIALLIAVDLLELPKLPLTTSAPFAARVVDRVDDRAPGQARRRRSPARTGMIETSQLTPAMSAPLLPSAPIVPATCVPWPLKSSGVLSFWMKSQPRVSSIFPFRRRRRRPGGSSVRPDVVVQLRVVVGDAAVDDGDDDFRAARLRVPGLGRVDVVVAGVVQAPEQVEVGIVRRAAHAVEVVRLGEGHARVALERRNCRARRRRCRGGGRAPDPAGRAGASRTRSGPRAPAPGSPRRRRRGTGR